MSWPLFPDSSNVYLAMRSLAGNAAIGLARQGSQHRCLMRWMVEDSTCALSDAKYLPSSASVRLFSTTTRLGRKECEAAIVALVGKPSYLTNKGVLSLLGTAVLGRTVMNALRPVVKEALVPTVSVIILQPSCLRAGGVEQRPGADVPEL